jgi:hypothetical protein
LTLDQADLQTGDSTSARARVTQNGAPAAGKTVMFAAGDARVASVSPTTAVTDGSGQAIATVKAESRGETTVSVSANGATDSKPVRVPDLSLIGVVMILLAAIIITRLRKRAV